MMYDCNDDDDDGVLRLVGCVRVVSVSHLPNLLINVLLTIIINDEHREEGCGEGATVQWNVT